MSPGCLVERHRYLGTGPGASSDAQDILASLPRFGAIRGPSGFSWIHGLSVFTLVTLATGVLAARAHRVQAHRMNMISLYAGALVITGLFTLLPGRLLGRVVWGWLGVV